MKHYLLIAVFAVSLLGLLGCQTDPAVEPATFVIGPDYSRPLPDGMPAIRKLDRRDWPDLAHAFETRDPLLLDAVDRSVLWFTKPSSKTHFPVQSISHAQSQSSVIGMQDLLNNAPDRRAFMADLERMFDVYESVGYNGEGVVLYTGYYSPVLNASLKRTGAFQYPLYTRPDDLVTDEKTGRPLGRRTANGDIVPYYTRGEIESRNMFEGSELVWLPDAMSAYIVHVNGSAKLRLRDGSAMYVGYAGKTDRPYASLGRAMVEAQLLDPNRVSLSEMKKAFAREPESVRQLMHANQSYVFFQQYPQGNWPAGSLGFPVTRERSLATDKSVYPRGGLILVDTETLTMTGAKRRFSQFMLDQDTGGAIKAPGRADIFMGIGPTAEIVAGGQYAEGRLYYVFLKPEYIDLYAPQPGVTTATANFGR